MNLLDKLPLWGLFIWLAVAYLVGHIAGLPRRGNPAALPRGRMLILRGLSTLLLVVAFFWVAPGNLATTTLLAVASGFLGGRSSPVPPRRGSPPSSPESPPEDGGQEPTGRDQDAL